MRFRAPIEQAKGILIVTHACSPDEAFRILQKMSNDSNRKLRDVAADLVLHASGDRPNRASTLLHLLARATRDDVPD